MIARLPRIRVAAFLVVILQTATAARAQNPQRISIDSVLGADIFRGEKASDRPDLIVDIAISARVGRGWTAYLRPWFLQPKTTTWNKEIYQAALQYHHDGRVATRLDVGYIASPFGLGMLDMRPGINPLIVPHLSYIIPLTPFEHGPPVGAIAASYPFGAQITASTARWDVRAAVLNSTPTRAWVINRRSSPPPTPALVVGGGITPRTGLRFGLSAAYGNYVTDAEVPAADTDYGLAAAAGTPAKSAGGRPVTMLAAEGEYAFAYTRVTGEFTYDRFSTSTGHASAYAWYVQGMQTLSPRWFVAARQEGMQAPPLMGVPVTVTPIFHISEATVGYRLSNEFTLRSSAFATRPYMSTNWNRQIGVSLVWTHRWW